MDWRHMLSVSPHNLADERKDEIAVDLAAIPTDQKLDSKSCKKLFRLAQVVLRFRNEQVGKDGDDFFLSEFGRVTLHLTS